MTQDAAWVLLEAHCRLGGDVHVLPPDAAGTLRTDPYEAVLGTVSEDGGYWRLRPVSGADWIQYSTGAGGAAAGWWRLDNLRAHIRARLRAWAR